MVEVRCVFDKHTYKEMVLSPRFLYVVLFTGIISFAVMLLGFERIFKYRYHIVTVIFVLSVVLRVSGSSIGMIAGWIGYTDSDVLYGASRLIRVDEWAVFTPMTWSQYYGDEPFSYFSSIIRATPTDVFIVYGLPIRSFLMIFRPFQIGYLFLPFANGLAFFWMGRLITLFMVSFEFGRLITNDNRRLSVLYAVMLTFAPVIQWWFAINGFVEMLIFMQLSIVVFNMFLQTQKTICKVLFAFVIAICAGGYVLTMYPAWMIPLAYILAVFIIWTIVHNKETYRFKRTDALIFAIPVLLLLLAALYVYKHSHGTIEAISATVYPGQRSENGGDFLKQFFNSFSCFWYPLTEKYTFANISESSGFISLFPLGIILYLRYVYQTRKKDLMASMLLIVFAFLGCYCVFGLPEFVAKITLIDHSIQNRVLIIQELSDLLLLIRALYLCESSNIKIPVCKSVCEACLISFVLTWIAYSINSSFFTTATITIQFILLFSIVITVLIGVSDERFRSVSYGLIIVTLLISGLLVNPVRIGVRSIEEVPILQLVSKTVSEDPDGIWIVEGIGYPYNNYLVMEGARTINSTNPYPDLERWGSIDEGEDDSEVYNRYAHMRIVYDNNPDEEFVLTYEDNFTVSVNDDELRSLGVDYIFTDRVFEETDPFQLIGSENGFNVYKVSLD
ncbi:MAG: hypothetical protein K6F79_00125 [Saccharofermentans sp.]|nr:hypothetical protein [Saccharofermentans sp.]